MVGAISSLLKEGLSDSDIRILAYANFDSDEFQKIARGLDYWCRKWKDKRLPTPVNMVYCLENQKMVLLPFLDTTIDPEKFWGVEIDNLFIYKKAKYRVALADVNDALQEKRNVVKGIRLPMADDMRHMIRYYRDISNISRLLRRYGIDFDDWVYSSYWMQEPSSPISIGVSRGYNVFERLPASDDKECILRPVFGFSEERDFYFIGYLDKYGFPDKKSEKYAKKLSKK